MKDPEARSAAVVLLNPQPLGGLHRLPVGLTVVEGGHVLGVSVALPAHALHVPGV